MKFYCRPVIDIDVRNQTEAVAFYKDVLGFDLINSTPDTSGRVNLNNGLVTLGVRNNNTGLTSLEFRVDCLESAKKFLCENGCEFLNTNESNRIQVKDPFGTHFDLVQL